MSIGGYGSPPAARVEEATASSGATEEDLDRREAALESREGDLRSKQNDLDQREQDLAARELEEPSSAMARHHRERRLRGRRRRGPR